MEFPSVAASWGWGRGSVVNGLDVDRSISISYKREGCQVDGLGRLRSEINSIFNMKGLLNIEYRILVQLSYAVHYWTLSLEAGNLTTMIPNPKTAILKSYLGDT